MSNQKIKIGVTVICHKVSSIRSQSELDINQIYRFTKKDLQDFMSTGATLKWDCSPIVLFKGKNIKSLDVTAEDVFATLWATINHVCRV